MPIVGCALAMCDGEGCKVHVHPDGTRGPARELVTIMKAPNGAMAGDPPPGWLARRRLVEVPGRGPVETLCPACAFAATKGEAGTLEPVS